MFIHFEVFGGTKCVAKEMNPSRAPKEKLRSNLSVADCKETEELVYDNIAICKIPQKLNRMFPLVTVISFNNCNIEIIRHDDFDDLNELKEIYLGNNKIKNVPNVFAKFKATLEVLNLENNQIQSIERPVLEELVCLKTLNLLGNHGLNKMFTIKDEASHIAAINECAE